jgi:hypothetical protein
MTFNCDACREPIPSDASGYTCHACNSSACLSCLHAWWDTKNRCECLRGCQVSYQGLPEASWPRLTDTIVNFHQREMHQRVEHIRAFNHVKDLEGQAMALPIEAAAVAKDILETFGERCQPWCDCETCTRQFNTFVETVKDERTRCDPRVFDRHIQNFRTRILMQPWKCRRFGSVTRLTTEVFWGIAILVNAFDSALFAARSREDYVHMVSEFICLSECADRVLDLAAIGEVDEAREIWSTHKKYVVRESFRMNWVSKAIVEDIETTVGPVVETTMPCSRKKKCVYCENCGATVTKASEFQCDNSNCPGYHQPQMSYWAYVYGGYHASSAVSFVRRAVDMYWKVHNCDVDWITATATATGQKRRTERLITFVHELTSAENEYRRVVIEFTTRRTRLQDEIQTIQLSNYTLSTSNDRGSPAFSTKPYFSVIKCGTPSCCGLVDFAGDGCVACGQHHCQACWQPSDEKHVCDSEDVTNATRIQSQCIQCVACRTIIEKASGCSHMYCVHCHTGFDERTQEILGGFVMNPHFFDEITNRRDQQVPGYTFESPRSNPDVPLWNLFTYDVLVYHGLCAYVYHEVLEAYVSGNWDRFQDVVEKAYPRIHRYNSVFAGRNEPTVEFLGDMRGWINTEFSKPAHCGMFYSRIMYDRHHV